MFAGDKFAYHPQSEFVLCQQNGEMVDFIVFPCLFRPWTTDTPITKSAFCCVSCHFVRMSWSFILHLLTFPVGHVVQHAREDDFVKKTLRFVPGLRHACVVAFAVFAKTCRQDTRAIQCQSTDLQCRSFFFAAVTFHDCFCVVFPNL